jgi:hypothetical protein
VQDETRDLERCLAGMRDALDRVLRQVDAVTRFQRLPQRLAGQSVVREEQGAVDIEQHKQGHQIPRRSSIASSRRHFGRAFTFKSRKIG